MPAPLDVNREAVRMLAQDIGVRPAARQLNLPESTVKSWSTREGWFEPAPVAATMLQQPASGASISPAVARQELMREMDGKGRFALATGLLSAAEHVATLPGESVLAQSPEIASLVKSTAQVHAWQDTSSSTVRVSIYSGEQPVMIDVEAEVLPTTGQDS